MDTALAQEVNTNQALSALADLQAMANGGQASDVLSSLGVNSSISTNPLSSSVVSDFSATAMIAGFVFGLIGLVAFIYGRKEGKWKPVLIGILLMCYPYFVADSVWLFAIGTGLTALLFFWRDR